MENLVIVESPNKKTTIEKYLGAGAQRPSPHGRYTGDVRMPRPLTCNVYDQSDNGFWCNY